MTATKNKVRNVIKISRLINSHSMFTVVCEVRKGPSENRQPARIPCENLTEVSWCIIAQIKRKNKFQIARPSLLGVRHENTAPS